MNKILFDGLSLQSKQPGQFHGGGEYAKFLLREAITAGYTFDVVLSRQLYTDPVIEQYLGEHLNIKVYMVDGKQGVYDLINSGQYARFFSALPNIYSDYPCSTPLFGVIHGLRSIELPWDYYRYKYTHTPNQHQGGTLHCGVGAHQALCAKFLPPFAPRGHLGALFPLLH